MLQQLFLGLGLVAGLLPSSYAQSTLPATSAALQLVPFASDEGMARLARSTARVDFPVLANQFEPQSNGAFCGPTSLTIVLNALFSASTNLPRDRSRLQSEDFRYIPPKYDLTLPRFTQDTVIAKGPKTRAQIFGEPHLVNGKQIPDHGYQVRQLDETLRAHGASTRLVIIGDKLPEDEVRKDLVSNLQQRGDYLIISYRREAAGQRGGGHISPLAAYDAESDSFLLMDVNPTHTGWVWMPTAALVSGMRTFDTVENRGYIHIGKP